MFEFWTCFSLCRFELLIFLYMYFNPVVRAVVVIFPCLS